MQHSGKLCPVSEGVGSPCDCEKQGQQLPFLISRVSPPGANTALGEAWSAPLVRHPERDQATIPYSPSLLPGLNSRCEHFHRQLLLFTHLTSGHLSVMARALGRDCEQQYR